MPTDPAGLKQLIIETMIKPAMDTYLILMQNVTTDPSNAQKAANAIMEIAGVLGKNNPGGTHSRPLSFSAVFSDEAAAAAIKALATIGGGTVSGNQTNRTNQTNQTDELSESLRFETIAADWEAIPSGETPTDDDWAK